jgi:tetratricopeptide (TPR) repeat protein
MAWLVEFLKAWYSSREILEETERLANQFEELMRVGQKALATETLDYRQYLADAMNGRFKGSVTDRLVNDSLDAEEMDRVRGMIRSNGLTQLCADTLGRLMESGFITAHQSECEDTRRRQWMARIGESPGPEAVLGVLDPKGVPLHENPYLWVIRASALHDLGRDDEALEDLETGARFVSENVPEALLKAEVLFNLHRFRETIGVLSRHGDEFAASPRTSFLLAASSAMLGDLDRAFAVCEAALARHEDRALRVIFELLYFWRQRPSESVRLFDLLVRAGAFPGARRVWDERIGGTIRAAHLVAGLPSLINEGNRKFLRTLIRESKLDDELLPLAVALDCLETGDRSPLERLSAEVRPIAEEIVAELQKKLSMPEQAMGA